MKKTAPQRVSDEELVRLYCSTGDQQYFTPLYSRYARKVHSTCLHFTKDDHKARDYAQDIFLQVLQKIDRFQSKSTFSTWLYALSRNYCLTQQRINTPDFISLLTENGAILDVVDDYDEDENRLSRLQQALARLSIKEVEILMLKYYDDLEMAQISQQLQLNIGVIKMRLKRSRDKLRELLVKRNHD